MCILGIASSDSIFKLILELNKNTPFELKVAQAVHNPAKNNSISFPHSVYYSEELQVHVIKNKNNGFILFDKAKIFDFLLIYKGEYSHKNITDIIESIKNNIKSITMISEIDPKKIKNLKETISTASNSI
jgi:hypothetical protein